VELYYIRTQDMKTTKNIKNMKKGTKVIVKIKVKAKDESKLPDWGLGLGILAEQAVILKEKPTQQNKVRLAIMLEDVYKDLLEDTIEKIIEIQD
jgi:hypothetical protein